MERTVFNGRVRVRLLGPIDVVIDGVPRPLPGLRRRAIVAMLALRRGEVVSTDSLIETVWSDGAPSTLNTIQANISQLRHLLGARDAIVARPPGYVLAGADEPTDVEEAERLIAQGTGPIAAEDQARHLRAALALWRGPSLADVAEVPWLDAQARRLDEVRLRAQCALIGARLALGEHAQVLPDLHRLVEEYWFDEQIHSHLILALYRSGRPTEALETYQRLRDRMRDELGVDPSPALSRLEAAVLRHDPALSAPGQAEPPTAIPAHTPAQLPAGARGFAGRRGRSRGPRRPPDRAGDRPSGRDHLRQRRRRQDVPWPCTGRTGSPSASLTASSTSTYGASTRSERRWIRPRRCAGSWRRWASRRSASRPTPTRAPRCTAASLADATHAPRARQRPRRRSRFGRCCPARRAASCW